MRPHVNTKAREFQSSLSGAQTPGGRGEIEGFYFINVVTCMFEHRKVCYEKKMETFNFSIKEWITRLVRCLSR